MNAARRLVLVRHASAVPTSPHGDEARELTRSGVDEARALGAWLKKQGLLGESVLCSPAMRTRQTWAAIDEETAHGVLIEMQPAIYEAGVHDLLKVIEAADPSSRTLVVVGHAPGIPALAAELAGGSAEPDAAAALERGFPPASCAVVSVETDWAGIAPGVGHLDSVRSGTL